MNEERTGKCLRQIIDKYTLYTHCVCTTVCIYSLSLFTFLQMINSMKLTWFFLCFIIKMLDKRIIYTKCMYNCLYHVSSIGKTVSLLARHSFMIAVTVRVRNHCPAFLWWQFTVSCRIIVYVLNGAVPSNVKRMIDW
jgi:lysylphosphatidylglycerol synthetase-like protein (DUF2156 family)